MQSLFFLSFFRNKTYNHKNQNKATNIQLAENENFTLSWISFSTTF